MSARLPTGVVVGALLRRVNDTGGMGMVRAQGEAQAGGVLLIIGRAGEADRVLERGLGPDGTTALIESTPSDGDIESYWRRRRQRDPDLWIIELDSPESERFAAETIGVV